MKCSLKINIQYPTIKFLLIYLSIKLLITVSCLINESYTLGVGEAISSSSSFSVCGKQKAFHHKFTITNMN